MVCPFCGSEDTKVLDTRMCKGERIRKRTCESCSERFSTAERITAEYLNVRKRSGKTEKFSRQKIAKGIEKAAMRNVLSPADVTAFVERVVQILQPDAPDIPVPSREIGKLVLQQLHSGEGATDVASIRFAMVFLGRITQNGGFRRVDDFLTWLEETYGPAQVAAPTDMPSLVVKRNGETEPFQPEKLTRSIEVAAKGRGTDANVRSLGLNVVAAVQRELAGQSIVTTGQISAEALKELRRLDALAYLRYASAVKRYRSVDDFRLEATAMTAMTAVSP